MRLWVYSQLGRVAIDMIVHWAFGKFARTAHMKLVFDDVRYDYSPSGADVYEQLEENMSIEELAKKIKERRDTENLNHLARNTERVLATRNSGKQVELPLFLPRLLTACHDSPSKHSCTSSIERREEA